MPPKKLTSPSLIWYFIILIFILTVGFLWVQSALQPVDSNDSELATFIIPKGLVTENIAAKLKDAHLIKSSVAFKYTVARYGLSRKLQAGSFKLSPSMTTTEIAKALTQGTSDIWVTILEGWRHQEIIDAIIDTFSEKDITLSQPKLLALAELKEGYLYPDTYLIPTSAQEEDIIGILEDTFNQRVVEDLEKQINQSPYDLHQIITMASLIEREAKTDQPRAMIAGILWKRLENDWPLQVDATLQYALGFNAATQDWWTPPLAKDKEVNSLYNTYKFPGLPPGPICSPSLSSIIAALNPIDTDNWFYLTDSDGNMHYAPTIEAHNANINKYLK